MPSRTIASTSRNRHIILGARIFNTVPVWTGRTQRSALCQLIPQPRHCAGRDRHADPLARDRKNRRDDTAASPGHARRGRQDHLCAVYRHVVLRERRRDPHQRRPARLRTDDRTPNRASRRTRPRSANSVEHGHHISSTVFGSAPSPRRTRAAVKSGVSPVQSRRSPRRMSKVPAEPEGADVEPKGHDAGPHKCARGLGRAVSTASGMVLAGLRLHRALWAHSGYGTGHGP